MDHVGFHFRPDLNGNEPSLAAKHREDWQNSQRRPKRPRSRPNPSLLSREDWLASERARWSGVTGG